MNGKIRGKPVPKFISRHQSPNPGNLPINSNVLYTSLQIATKMDRVHLNLLHSKYGTPRASDPPKSSGTVIPPSPFDPASTPTTLPPMPSVMKDLNNSPPSPLTIAIAIGLLGLLAGYFVGQGRSIGLFGGSGSASGGTSKKKRKGKKSWPNSYDVKIHEDSSSEDVAGVGTGETESESEEEEEEDLEDSENAQEVKAFEGSREEVKLVLCLRTDLGMTKGTSTSSPPPSARNPTKAHTNLLPRQNGSTSLPRHARMLQIPLVHPLRRITTKTVGERRAGESCVAGQERGRAANAAGAGG
jgi:hypothetical protein